MEEKAMPKERPRRGEAKRKIKRLPIILCCGQEKREGKSSNLSLTGIFIKIRKPFPEGSLVSISLMVCEEKEEKIFLSGKVVRSIKGDQTYLSKKIVTNCMGIRLDVEKIPEEYQNFLEKLY